MADATVTLGLDTQQYSAGLKSVEQESKATLARISQLRTKFPDIFGNGQNGSGSSNGSKGIDQFIAGERKLKTETRFLITELLYAQNAMQGATAAAIAFGEATRFGAGIAVGVAAIAIGFQKVREQIDATKKANERFFESFNRPGSLIKDLSPEGIGSEIGSSRSALAERQKQQKTFASAVIDTYRNLPSPFSGRTAGGFFSGGEQRRDKAQQEDIAAMDRLDALAKLRGEAELKRVNAQEKGLIVSEREGELEKIKADFAAKRSAIKLDERDPGTADRLKALDKEEQLANYQVERRSFLREQERESAGRVLDIEKRAGTEGEKRIDVLRNELKLLHEKSLISGPLESKKDLELQTKAKERDLQLAEVAEDLRQREIESTRTITDIEESGLTTGEKRIASLKEQLVLIDDQRKAAIEIGDTEQEQIKSIQKRSTQNDLDQAAFAESKKTWSQHLADMNAAQDLQNFRYKDIPTAIGAYKTSPDAYGQNTIYGAGGTASPDAYRDSRSNQLGHGYQTPTFNTKSFDDRFGKLRSADDAAAAAAKTIPDADPIKQVAANTQTIADWTRNVVAA